MTKRKPSSPLLTPEDSPGSKWPVMYPLPPRWEVILPRDGPFPRWNEFRTRTAAEEFAKDLYGNVIVLPGPPA
jgi:hypothetical protein